MLCFSLVSPNSLRGILDFHYPEIKKIRPDLRFVLVGLKSDLRDECNESSYNENAYHSRQIIPSSQIEEVKNIIGAEAYVECSAKNNEHVVDVIEAGFRALIAKRNENTLTLRESEQNKCQLR
ncbi:rac-like GTP-binding protein ARAC7 [Histomonas meleagridis]|uniref:rac-like GTP-binding protein ARAC7 n=1 Tax=Histomonas meleagridis TaxID=135588 RepID=UPI00355ACAF0|nr:rac-like GTP-binding protein ARAC7 [Histomonas meleagridis]KAH0803776.1 rac-like GTP-binding protein ARAC7 [Histomonas meleagridis]